MKRLQGYFFAHLLVFFLTPSTALWAQSERASIVGNVADPSGAVVSGATVKVTNEATGVGFETKTDDGGRYVTPSILKPGTYKVEVSRDGFKTKVTSGVVLEIGDVEEINVTLEVGAVGETVTVTSEAPQLETETSNRGEVITGRQVTELPLKDRNFTQLALLTPGVSRAYIGATSDQTAFNQGDPNAGTVPGLGNAIGDTPAARFSRSGGANISANGLRPSNNNFTLDGVDNNENLYGTIGVYPNPDAIAEFKVETSVGKAETGRGGATVNAAFQSGTNSFHGSVFYYHQNEFLNATHAQIRRQRAEGIASGQFADEAAAEAALPKTTFRIHEFGGTLGGPIIKNRTFFFGDYLGQRNLIPNFFRTAVPTAASRMGDFSDFTGAIVDPLTCPLDPTIAGGRNTLNPLCTTFPGNVIPNLQGRTDFDQVGFNLLNVYPLPTDPTVVNPSQGNPNFVGTRRNQERINAYNIKIDHRLFENNNITGRYSNNDQERVRAGFFPGLGGGFGSGTEIGNTRQIAVIDTHAFRPTILNEVRFGYTEVEIGILNPGVLGSQGVSPTLCSDIGIPNCNLGTDATTGMLPIGGFGTGEFEFLGDNGPFLVNTKNFFVADNVTIVSGKHTWKAGIEVRPRNLETICGGCAGLKGNIQYADADINATTSTTTGNVQADFLLGRPALTALNGTIVGGDTPFDLNTTEWSFFVQDDWKVAPNLTLNLGVRYDIFPGWTESNGRQGNYDAEARELIRATDGGDRIIGTDTNNIAPRIGFAYSFGENRNMVLRGGYGIFYTQDTFDTPPLIRNPPITTSVNRGVFAGDVATIFNASTGPPPVTASETVIFAPTLNLFELQAEQKTATVHQWNLTLQWEFARDWLLDLGYVASRSRNLAASRQLGNNDNGLGFARTPLGPASPTNPSPDTVYNSVVAFENRASANYDGLQAKVEKRFSHGFQGRLAYTWSHNIDDSTGVFGGPGETRGNSGGPLNPLDFRSDRSTSSLDHRHLFNANAIWDLPFGRGKHFGGDMSSGWDKMIGGWQANFIFSGQTGQHFGVQGDAPGFRTTANLVDDPFAGVVPGRFLNVAAFNNPVPANPQTTCVTNLAGKLVCFGNTGRNQFTGPGYFRTDFSLFKNTAITEQIRFQLGIEFFNIFNHNNHVVPNNYIDRGNNVCNPANAAFNPSACSFGRFDNSLPPRQMQLRLKVLF